MSDLVKQAAYTAGRHAAGSGRPLNSCPYDAGGETQQQVLALWWLRGYRSDNEPDDQPAEGEGA